MAAVANRLVATLQPPQPASAGAGAGSDTEQVPATATGAPAPGAAGIAAATAGAAAAATGSAAAATSPGTLQPPQPASAGAGAGPNTEQIPAAATGAAAATTTTTGATSTLAAHDVPVDRAAAAVPSVKGARTRGAGPLVWPLSDFTGLKAAQPLEDALLLPVPPPHPFEGTQEPLLVPETEVPDTEDDREQQAQRGGAGTTQEQAGPELGEFYLHEHD